MASQDEQRRQFTRVDISCPVSMISDAGRHLAKGKTLNAGDGGLLLSVPVEMADKMTGAIDLHMCVPRSTDNTFMFEDFTCRANVIRRHPLADDSHTGIVVQFTQPIDLGLEV